MADKIGRNDGIPSSNALRILASPFRTPALQADGYKSSFSFSEILP